ncbi:MAG: amino acid adenylation domain-containing protein [Acidobacteria bacterium]|nr:amino acid adenylation domain-containing protein [Acidobacteriota bacterium]
MRTLDIHVSVEGDRLRCSAPPGRITKEIEESLAEHKSELIRALLSASNPQRIGRRPTAGKPVPLSFAQEGFWFAQKLNPNSTAYNITAWARIQARVNSEVLEQALRALVHKHESLRTRFTEVAGVPAQEVLEDSNPCLELFDLSERKDDEREKEAKATIQRFGARPFDFGSGQLFRVALIRLSAENSIVVFAVHHIVCDGWSLGVFFKELRSTYVLLLAGEAPDGQELPVQYADYALWERKRVSSPPMGGQIGFWKEKLKGASTLIDLPLDHPRSPSSAYEARLFAFELDTACSEALKQLGRDCAATPFMVLLAVFTALLSRYSGEKDIVVGTPVSTRVTTHLEKLIGCFINTQLLRTEVSPENTSRELVRRVRSTVMDSLCNADVPFAFLVKELLPNRDPSRSLLFQHAFILLNTPRAEDYEVESGGTANDMTLYMWEADGKFHGSIQYDGALFDPETIRCFSGCYQTLATQMASMPDEPLGQLAAMSPEQEKDWFRSQSGISLELPVQCVPDWVRLQSESTPEKVAVMCGPEQLTYRELCDRSRFLARRLRESGVRPGDLVALCLSRTIDLVVAPLATWMAGAAYVPLDPTFPARRLAHILQDSEPAAIITESSLLDRIPDNVPSLICLDKLEKGHTSDLSTSPSAPANSEDLAYLMFTSGSTGTPKGVEIQHRSLVNLLASMQREPGIGVTDRLLAVTTLSFDISGLELFLPLVSGAQLVIAPGAALTDANALARLISEFDITIMQATPATWRLLLESGWKGKPGLKVLCGGEALPRQLAEQLLSTGAELWNLYGPTETTIWSTVQRMKAPVERIPIGHPIANTQTYVLDETGKPSLPGQTGELFIGGAGLARGYRKQADLTSEKFVLRRHQNLEARLYRTGDLVRRLPDGSLEFVSRLDQQVKLRGFRIELEEIQTALEGHPAVAQAIAIVREDRAGEKYLIAYWRPLEGASATPADLRRSLRSVLPEIMIPAEYVELDSFPKTPNGKIDRKALLNLPPKAVQGLKQDSSEDRTDDEIFSAPTDYVERKLEAIWREVLQVDRIEKSANFFELGGHSLLAARVASRIRAELNTELPLQAIFADPTIAGLASHLHFESSTRNFIYTCEAPQWKRVVPVQPLGERAPLFFLAGYHDPGGPLLFLSHLVPHLGDDQPVFGFQPRWMDGQGEDYASVEAIARDYLAELRVIQPRGPYFLGGNCVEGVAVLEIARILEQEGEKVQLVVLLDTERPTLRNIIRRELYSCGSRVKHVAEVLWEIVRAQGTERVRAIRELAIRKAGIASASLVSENDRFHQHRANYCRLLYRHRPEPWSGCIKLIGNKEDLRVNKDFGWSGFSQADVDVHAIPGSHETMLIEHGREVAHMMRSWMDEAQQIRTKELDTAEARNG